MNKQKLRLEIVEQMEIYLNHAKITHLKPVKRVKSAIKKSYQSSLPACPECSSRLSVDATGVIFCSQDKLQEIYKRCLEYDSANKNDQIRILKEDSGQLLEFYERWKKKDSNGNRPFFSCTYSSKLHSPLPSYNFYMSDPIQVKRLERKLKRRLFESELNGTVKVMWKDKSGKVYEERIDLIRFPWGLL